MELARILNPTEETSRPDMLPPSRSAITVAMDLARILNPAEEIPGSDVFTPCRPTITAAMDLSRILNPTEETASSNVLPPYMPTIFHRFKELPFELRREIWESALPDPRVIHIWAKCTIPSRDGWVRNRWSDKEVYKCLAQIANPHIPSMLWTSHEARVVALKVYTPISAASNRTTRTYFDFQRDTLYITEKDQPQYDRWVHEFEDGQEIKTEDAVIAQFTILEIFSRQGLDRIRRLALPYTGDVMVDTDLTLGYLYSKGGALRFPNLRYLAIAKEEVSLAITAHQPAETLPPWTLEHHFNDGNIWREDLMDQLNKDYTTTLTVEFRAIIRSRNSEEQSRLESAYLPSSAFQGKWWYDQEGELHVEICYADIYRALLD